MGISAPTAVLEPEAPTTTRTTGTEGGLVADGPVTGEKQNEAAEAETVEWDFDYHDQHCYYDPAELLADVEPSLVARIAALWGKPLDEVDGYDWDQIADRLDRIDEEDAAPHTTGQLEEVAAQIRDGLHTSCDCASLVADYTRESFDYYFDDYLSNHPRVFVVGYDEEADAPRRYGRDRDVADIAEFVASELTFEMLVEQFQGRGGYDGFKATFDPRTGRGTIAFSDRGYGSPHAFEIITDPERYEFLDAFYDGHVDTMLVRQAAKIAVSAPLTRAVQAVIDAPEITAGDAYDTSCSYQSPSSVLYGDDGLAMFHTLRRAGLFTAPESVWNVVAALAFEWKGSITELIALGQVAAA